MTGFLERGWRRHRHVRFAALLLGKIGAGGLNLLAFMVMAAAVGAKDISAYAITVAVMSVLSATSEASEYAYIRAVVANKTLMRPLVALYMLKAKAITVALCVLAVATVFVAKGLAVDVLPRWVEIIPLVCMQGITTIFLGSYTSYMAAVDNQKSFTKINFLTAVTSMAAAAYAWLSGGDIAAYLSVNVLLTLLLLIKVYSGQLAIFFRMARLAVVLQQRKDVRYLAVGQSFDAVYRSVLGVAFLSIVKNNVLIFVLGHQGSDEVLAYFAIVKRVFDFLHKGMMGFLDQLYVRLSKMADEQRTELEVGMLNVYIFRIAVGIFAAGMLLIYFKVAHEGSQQGLYLSLASVAVTFVIMYFVTAATLMVSKYEPRTLLTSSIYAAGVYGIVPLLFASIRDPAITPLAHLICGLLSGLPLCIRTFYRHGFRVVLVCYGVTVLLVTLGLTWFLISNNLRG